MECLRQFGGDVTDGKDVELQLALSFVHPCEKNEFFRQRGEAVNLAVDGLCPLILTVFHGNDLVRRAYHGQRCLEFMACIGYKSFLPGIGFFKRFDSNAGKEKNQQENDHHSGEPEEDTVFEERVKVAQIVFAIKKSVYNAVIALADEVAVLPIVACGSSALDGIRVEDGGGAVNGSDMLRVG